MNRSHLLAVEGVKEAMTNPAIATTSSSTSAQDHSKPPSGTNAQNSSSLPSRRRRGPAFLPSEHDELPKDVAFMTLSSHPGGITSLDFSEPYGVAVTAGQDDTVRVWDLCDGEEMGLLRGHDGLVKCVQVEGAVALTGGSDGAVRLWELGRVEEWEESRREAEEKRRKGLDGLLDASADHRLPNVRADMIDEHTSRQGRDEDEDRELANVEKDKRLEGDPCLRVLEGHSKSITSLYYEDNCLVTGSNDKTVRQWDVNTGQCILTMDILWAISNPPAMTINTINPATTPVSSPRRPGILGRGSTYRNSISSPYAGGGDYDPFDDPFLASPGPGMMMGMPGSGVLNATTGQFAVPTPPFADGSWEMYQDFVGGVQFWGYALATGSGDGGVRMWDSESCHEGNEV
jgi:division protein 1